MADDPKKPVLDNRSRQLNDHDVDFHLSQGKSRAEAERLAAEARKRDALKTPSH